MKVLRRVGGKIWLGFPGTLGVELSLTPAIEADLKGQGIDVPQEDTDDAVAIGSGARAEARGTAIGADSYAGEESVSIGHGAGAGVRGRGNVFIGAGAGGGRRSDEPR